MIIEMTAIEQYFPVVLFIILYKMNRMFVSVEQINPKAVRSYGGSFHSLDFVQSAHFQSSLVAKGYTMFRQL